MEMWLISCALIKTCHSKKNDTSWWCQLTLTERFMVIYLRFYPLLMSMNLLPIRSLLLVLVMILVELLFVRFVYVDQKTSQNWLRLWGRGHEPSLPIFVSTELLKNARIEMNAQWDHKSDLPFGVGSVGSDIIVSPTNGVLINCRWHVVLEKLRCGQQFLLKKRLGLVTKR